MGFEAFAPAVGSEEAKFVPMILTRSKFEQELEKEFRRGTNIHSILVQLNKTALYLIQIYRIALMNLIIYFRA